LKINNLRISNHDNTQFGQNNKKVGFKKICLLFKFGKILKPNILPNSEKPVPFPRIEVLLGAIQIIRDTFLALF